LFFGNPEPTERPENLFFPKEQPGQGYLNMSADGVQDFFASKPGPNLQSTLALLCLEKHRDAARLGRGRLLVKMVDVGGLQNPITDLESM